MTSNHLWEARKVSGLWLNPFFGLLHKVFRKLFLFTPGEDPAPFFAFSLVLPPTLNLRYLLFLLGKSGGVCVKKGNFKEKVQLLHL